MKKIAVIALSLCFSSAISQSTWDMNLNNVNPPDNPNFGTANNNPINFFTNGAQKMSLSPTGVLQINGLAGSGSRFLQTDASGNIVPWTGSMLNANSILFGDGTWRPNLITVDGNRMFIPSGAKFGLGISNPATQIDVIGSAKISNGIGIENGLFIGGASDYAVVDYQSATPSSPALFKIGGGGVTNPNNPSSGNNYNPAPWIGSNTSTDPQPNWACLSGESTPNSLPPSATILNNVLCVKKVVQSGPASVALAGNINIGHNGFNAFIETQGASLNVTGNEGDLFINSKCNRSVYVFGNGTSFSPSSSQILSVAGKLNVTDNMQLGGGTAITNFLYNNTRLYIYSPPTAPIGLKLRHGGGGESAIKIIELGDNEKAFAINKGTATQDGAERFSILANGYTEINVQTPMTMPNNRVLTIKDATINRDLFVVKSDGKVYAREVEISLSTIFPDYVFNKEYKLMTLNDLAAFIDKNKHLPGFEKGQHYQQYGLNVNTMIVKQQEKIEELTLYIIELEKRLSKLERGND